MLLADADFFIGLYLALDAHHPECIAISKKINEEVITSHDVTDEVITKLNYFKRKDLALQFYKKYIADIKIIYPDRKMVDRAIDVMNSQVNIHISLTDCINIAIAKEKNIKYILSFDKIYERNGLKLFK